MTVKGWRPHTPADTDDSRMWLDDQDGAFRILPENWDTFLVWLDLADQWDVVAGFASLFFAGLPNERIDRALARRKLTGEAEQIAYEDIKAMAAVAKPILNKGLAGK